MLALLLGFVGVASAEGPEAVVGRAVIGTAVQAGMEVGGALGGAMVGATAGVALTGGDILAGTVLVAAGGGLGLAGGMTAGGAVAGVATGRPAGSMAAITTGVSALGLVGLIAAGSGGDGEAMGAIAVGTLVAVPIAAGVGAALLPERRRTEESLSFSPTFGRHGGGLQIAGRF